MTFSSAETCVKSTPRVVTYLVCTDSIARCAQTLDVRRTAHSETNCRWNIRSIFSFRTYLRRNLTPRAAALKTIIFVSAAESKHMSKEQSKGPTTKPVPIDDPLAQLIDQLSDEIEPIAAPTPEQDADAEVPLPSDPNTGEPENTA